MANYIFNQDLQHWPLTFKFDGGQEVGGMICEYDMPRGVYRQMIGRTQTWEFRYSRNEEESSEVLHAPDGSYSYTQGVNSYRLHTFMYTDSDPGAVTFRELIRQEEAREPTGVMWGKANRAVISMWAEGLVTGKPYVRTSELDYVINWIKDFSPTDETEKCLAILADYR